MSASPAFEARAKAAREEASSFHKAQKTKKRSVGLVGAGVALVATAGSHLAPTPSFPEYIENGVCSMEGGSKARTLNEDDRSQNRLKNRFTAPDPVTDIDPKITIDSLDGPDATDLNKNLRTSSAAKVVGYIQDIRSGGPETANCQVSDDEFWDTHIYIGRTRLAALKDCIIAEVTPRVRQTLRSGTAEWDTSVLKKTFRPGTKVEVTGWLFYDKEHWNNAANNPKHAVSVWRASCWEIHPVTNIVLLAKPSPNEVSSHVKAAPSDEPEP
jgi:hypothetical protein